MYPTTYTSTYPTTYVVPDKLSCDISKILPHTKIEAEWEDNGIRKLRMTTSLEDIEEVQTLGESVVIETKYATTIDVYKKDNEIKISINGKTILCIYGYTIGITVDREQNTFTLAFYK